MSAPKTGNPSLNRAKRAKNDEFYTQLGDIEHEVGKYWDLNTDRNPFEGKTILMNCDPAWSNFWKYFARRFDHLGISRLIATHYEPDGSPSYAMFLERDADGNMVDLGTDEHGTPRGRMQALEGDGDFRSEECVALLKESDIVVTNPPFSLFREHVAQLVEHEKQFLIIGNKNAVTYKETFPLLKANQMWIGFTPMGKETLFGIPREIGESLVAAGKDHSYTMVGDSILGRAPVCWFTNLDHLKRHEELALVRHYEGNEDAYPRYDNFAAINVDKVADIPGDYAGLMGVPITFLGKHNPDQFEIVGLDRYVPDSPHPGRRFNLRGRRLYARLLIRNRKPQPKINYATERAA